MTASSSCAVRYEASYMTTAEWSDEQAFIHYQDFRVATM